MKQHIKKIHFLVIALFTIMLSSCSDDLYHQGSKSVAKNKTVSIEEFKRNTGLHNFSKTFKIPKDKTAENLTLEECLEIIEKDGKTAKRPARKTTTKSTTTKSTTTKSTTTKKTAKAKKE